MADFTLYTLGCGSAKPTPRHNPSCTVLNIRDTLYMIDCGEGAQKEFQRQRLKFTRLNHIFLTHLHGDHCLGLPGLLGTLGLTGFGGEVTIHTFADGIKVLKEITDYFCGPLPYKLNFHEITYQDNLIFENNYLSVHSIKLNHRIPSVGYLFKEKPRSRRLKGDMADYLGIPIYQRQAIKEGADFIKSDGTIIPNGHLTLDPPPSLSYAHIGDTSYIPEIAEKIKGCTLVYHETTYLEANAVDARKRGHSTAKEAALIAKNAEAKALLTGHYSSRYRNEEDFIKEAGEIFPRPILNKEGLTIDLSKL